MILRLEVNVMIGMSANGSWIIWTQFKKSFIPEELNFYQLHPFMLTSQILNSLRVERQNESWSDGDGPGDQHSLPLWPLNLHEPFHDKLSGVCSCHCGRLSGSKDSDSPDEHCSSSKLATKINSSLVNVNFDGFSVVWEDVGVRNVVSRNAHLTLK